jgi:hypothetical protein
VAVTHEGVVRLVTAPPNYVRLDAEQTHQLSDKLVNLIGK